MDKVKHLKRKPEFKSLMFDICIACGPTRDFSISTKTNVNGFLTSVGYRIFSIRYYSNSISSNFKDFYLENVHLSNATRLKIVKRNKTNIISCRNDGTIIRIAQGHLDEIRFSDSGRYSQTLL